MSGPASADARARGVLVIGIAAVALGAFTIALRPAPWLFSHPLLEDAYYSLSVARNIANGNGATIDGVVATNGFQPLLTFVQSLAFMITASDEHAIRLVLVLQWVIFVATAGVMGVSARGFFGAQTQQGSRALLVAPLLFMASFYAVNTAFNGLETGALLLAYAVMWWYLQRTELTTPHQAALLGLIAGATVLVRIDAIFVVAVLVLALAVRGVRQALVVAVTAVTASASWFVYNVVAFGSVMPTSGSAQTAVEVSGFRLSRMVEALSATLMPWVPLGPLGLTASVLVRVALIVVVVVAVVHSRALTPVTVRSHRSLTFMAVLAIGYGSLAVYYTSTSFAAWFYGRYMAPTLLLSVFVMTALVARTWHRAWVLVLSITAALGAIASIAQWNDALNPPNEMLFDQVALVEATVPNGVAVAAGQTGTLGFFRANVVNLDGKVNPQVREFDGDRRALLDDQGIDWVCDWYSIVDAYLGHERAGWVEVARRGSFVCLTRQ